MRGAECGQFLPLLRIPLLIEDTESLEIRNQDGALHLEISVLSYSVAMTVRCTYYH